MEGTATLGAEVFRRPRMIPRVAVVGLGYWGPNLVRVLLERTDVDVRWICDQDATRVDRLARRYPGIRTTQNIDEILADPIVDGVILATQVHTHFALAKRCMEAGKHTFVEKPLAASTTQAAELIDQSGELGLTLMCGHTFLYSPPVQAVKRLIDDGELGD